MKARAVAVRFFLFSFSLIILNIGSVAQAKSLPELSEDLQVYFQFLRNQPVNYKVDGTVCEQLTRLHFIQQYPESEFNVDSGVEYGDSTGVLGELDLIVTKKVDNEVVLLGEVKCWKSLDMGMDKAKFQRDRFLWNLQSQGRNLFFRGGQLALNYDFTRFEASPEYIFVSQVGGKKWGFQYELPLRLSQLDELQQYLVRCQKKGLCVQPSK